MRSSGCSSGPPPVGQLPGPAETGRLVTSDVLVIGTGAQSAALAQALHQAGLRPTMLADPLHGLPGWAASHPAEPMPAILPWLVAPSFTVDCLTPDGTLRHQGRALVVAVAMRERLLAFPGQHLPRTGGIGMALPAGARVLLVGPSPWRSAARRRIAAAGAVAVEPPEPAHVLRVLPAPGGLRVWLGDAPSGEVAVAVDHLMVADGWLAATDIFRLLRVSMRFDGAAQTWLPATDTTGRCTLPFLYRLGGTPEAQAATIAADLSAADWSPAINASAGAARAAGALDRRIAALADDAVICPCEGVTAGEARAQVAGGLREINQLKSATRCGMGTCGGRLCEDAASRLLAIAQGCGRADVGYWTGRAPLVPVPLHALTGDYDYADIPFPPAAPL